MKFIATIVSVRENISKVDKVKYYQLSLSSTNFCTIVDGTPPSYIVYDIMSQLKVPYYKNLFYALNSLSTIRIPLVFDWKLRQSKTYGYRGEVTLIREVQDPGEVHESTKEQTDFD